MINFETIAGTLCRMVEPEPLTEKSTFPCVVRFNTSDHRTINLRNRKPFILRNINNEGYVHYELAYAAHYSLFELLGYPVADGSAEWAYYSAHQGNFVFHPVLGAEEYFWWNTEKNCISCKSCDLPADSFFTCFMLSGIQDSGWQIHEPEQESITETTPCPACHGTGFVDSVFMDEGAVRSSCSCNALSKKSSHEPESNVGNSETTYNVTITDSNWKGHSYTWTGVPYHEADRIADALNHVSSTIAMPMTEPEPEYKVGDWVELTCCYKHQGQIKKIFPAGMGEVCETRIHRTNPTFTITGLSGEFEFSRIAKKLKHSEVVVHIGCLSGTVSRYSSSHIRLTHNGGGFSIIRITALDTNTAELVRELLKAQEEK